MAFMEESAGKRISTTFFLHYQTKEFFFTFFYFSFNLVSVCAHSELGMYNLLKFREWLWVIDYWL